MLTILLGFGQWHAKAKKRQGLWTSFEKYLSRLYQGPNTLDPGLSWCLGLNLPISGSDPASQGTVFIFFWKSEEEKPSAALSVKKWNALICWKKFLEIFYWILLEFFLKFSGCSLNFFFFSSSSTAAQLCEKVKSPPGSNLLDKMVGLPQCSALAFFLQPTLTDLTLARVKFRVYIKLCFLRN